MNESRVIAKTLSDARFPSSPSWFINMPMASNLPRCIPRSFQVALYENSVFPSLPSYRGYFLPPGPSASLMSLCKVGRGEKSEAKFPHLRQGSTQTRLFTYPTLCDFIAGDFNLACLLQKYNATRFPLKKRALLVYGRVALKGLASNEVSSLF